MSSSNNTYFSELIKTISTYSYVSFDVFDTLVMRTVSQPENIFDMVEYVCENEGRRINKGFAKIRKEAEAKVRRLKYPKEVTLDDIYNQMDVSDEERSYFKQKEIDIEVANCIPNTLAVDLLCQCKKLGKHIVITTDMYLPRIYFERVFQKCGIIYDDLFISGEEGVTKYTGDLYKKVLLKLGLSSSDLVHIGDNDSSDIQNANKNGIAAYKRPIEEYKTFENVFYFPSEKYNPVLLDHIHSLYRLKEDNDLGSSESVIGYSVLGPFLYEFCEWLHNYKTEMSIDRLFFVAREGYLIKECYETMYPEDSHILKYVRLSKNLIRLPILSEKLDDLDSFFKGLIDRDNYSWSMLLSKLGIEEQELFVKEHELEHVINDINAVVSREDLLHGQYKSLLMSIINIQKEILQEQKILFLEYLDDLEVRGKRIGLVNNSFNGSGQCLLEKFFKDNSIDCEIIGLQFVKSRKCIASLGNKVKAMLTEDKFHGFELNEFARLALIFEHLLFEPIGTAVKFNRSEGNVVVQCEPVRHEYMNFEIIKKIQDYVLSFIRDYSKCCPLPLYFLGFKSFIKLLQYPKQAEAYTIGQLWDDDDDEDKQLVNSNHQIPCRQLYARHFKSDDYWFEGLLAIKQAPLVYKVLYKFRKRFNYFRKVSQIL